MKQETQDMEMLTRKQKEGAWSQLFSAAAFIAALILFSLVSEHR